MTPDDFIDGQGRSVAAHYTSPPTVLSKPEARAVLRAAEAVKTGRCKQAQLYLHAGRVQARQFEEVK